jgi:hypothetical protein
LISTGATEVFSYQMSFLSAAVMALMGLLTLFLVVRMTRDERSNGVRSQAAS